MNTVSKGKNLWRGALLLTVATLLTKMLSVAYRIPYQNIAGDIGLYIYQQIYPFIGAAMILSTYGFPVVISKLIAEHRGNKADQRKIIKVAFILLLLLSISVQVLLYFNANSLALWMGDGALYLPLQVVSFSLLFLPFISVIRGYFQGIQQMGPTAISQIVDQTVRVITIILLSYILLMNGYSIYTSAAGAVSGSVLGGATAVIVLVLFFMKHRHKVIEGTPSISSWSIIRQIVCFGLFVCASNLFLIITQCVDAFTIKTMLSKYGFSEVEAKTLKGIYDRGFPLIQLGTVLATSFSLTLVPLIASMKGKGIHKKVKVYLQSARKMSVIVGSGATVGLLFIMEPTNIMLFTNNSGTMVLSVLVVSILFSSMFLTSSAILQGLGKLQIPVLHVCYGVLVKILLNSIFIPAFQTLGAAVATVIAFFFAAMLNEFEMKRQLHMKVFDYSVLKGIVFALLLMSFVIVIYGYIFQTIFPYEEVNRIYAALHAITSVILGGFVYIFSIIKMNVITRSELSMLPFGNRLSIIFRLNN